MADIFPYEIKRLIYENTNLKTIKILRQVSKSWASAGLALLLLPTFAIKSSLDIDRLLSISTNPSVSQHASKTIKTLTFQSDGWDPRYFKNIVCNRHELRQEYEAIDFVPTQAEFLALEELDAVIKQKDRDLKQDSDERILKSALRLVPKVDAVKILCQNPFTHQILRKSWEEYTLEAYQRRLPLYYQLLRIVSVAKDAGLTIRCLTHERLHSSFFENIPIRLSTILATLTSLTSLSLVISDLPGAFSSATSAASSNLRNLIFNSPALESLSLTFEVLGTVPMTFLEPLPSFLQEPNTGCLHTLTLSGVSLFPGPFFAFLSANQFTLRRLGLRMIALPEDTSSFRAFLEELRDRFGNATPDTSELTSRLEKFQLTGMIRSLDNEKETWLLFPCYDDEWQPAKEYPRNVRTKEMEGFVLRGGPWPMLESDRLDFEIS